jgi:UDP-N-acetyl-D-glucosamine dehydrogenase
MNDAASTLLQRIRSRQATVGIIGLGYVGLPLALAFTEKGSRVIGFDVDPAKPEKLGRGESYIRHLDGGRVLAMAQGGLFDATTDFARLEEADAVLICVPTPLTAHRDPDMRYVEASAEPIRAALRPGQLVVLESTTYPGTTDELVRGILERVDDSLPLPVPTLGNDFFLAFSPEREDPGNARYSTTNTPKIVGGVDDASGDLAEALYAGVIEHVVRVENARVAEASKLTENIFRAVNIALVNELKMVYDRMGIDVWSVLDAAETKPFGFMRFNPGPGFGGHCIPLDPFYLSWKARETGLAPKFIELAGEVNIVIPRYVIEKLQLALNERGKAVRNANVLVLGLAYKKNIDDPRESPAFELIEQLLELGADVSYHDPHIPVAPSMRSWPDLPPMQSTELTAEILAGADVILIATDHDAVDYDMVADNAQLIVDTRGVYRNPRPNIVKA